MLPDPTPGTALQSPDATRDRLAQPHRQAPVALAFIAWRFVKRIGLINIGAALFFVLTGGFSALLVAGATLAVTALLVFSLLSWWRFTFVVTGGELIVTSGILSVERLVIPLDRVQSVSIDQQLLHRLVGVVSASVDTAGSSGTEFEIAAIEADIAEALRLVAADARRDAPTRTEPGKPIAPAAPAVDRVLVRRSFSELALVGVTNLPWAGFALLAPVIALGDDLGRFTGLEDPIERFYDGSWIGSGSGPRVVAVVIGLVAAATVIGAALQMVREVLTNWNLTLYRTSTGLRRTAGLLTTTSRSSTLRRVQAITTDDTPPQRWLGFTNVTLKTFGDNDIGLPGSTDDEVRRLRRLVFGTTAPPPLDRRISRLFVFLAARNTAIVAIALSVVLRFGIGWWSVIVLAAVPIRAAVALRQWGRRRWGLDDHGIAESYELVTRHTAEAPLVKAQVVKVTQSFFERRRGLATIRIQTADGFLAVPLIDHATAMAVRDRALHAVETGRRAVI